jgi:hypothetical protein
VYLCVLCGSQNKQRLFPYTTLTDWFSNRQGVCLLRGTDWIFIYNSGYSSCMKNSSRRSHRQTDRQTDRHTSCGIHATKCTLCASDWYRSSRRGSYSSQDSKGHIFQQQVTHTCWTQTGTSLSCCIKVCARVSQVPCLLKLISFSRAAAHLQTPRHSPSPESQLT